ncbi:MAG: chromosome segregation protein SMC [Chloroflexi bacterium]|nr:chromosome segregation protein SMC [Chloroflexota bacterium]
MYVKRLTLQGFKSFAQETTFEFGSGVTAIIGPNGSGKSNVADAVRWVLGEQGLRLLRARKQEDVIFSGAGDSAPLGMAEVTLTLDNGDGWLPLDFSEIQIGRRAYRDGDTEYLLNGSRIRLRDLNDLLQKANVGQNSYAIMGQGMVDEVLSLSPQDRRSLIDEAADVKPFRVKIADAHNRLASTRENMAKVQIIVDELEPRLRLLRRQANRASEHRELSARLATLLRRLYSSRWSEARTAIARAQAELDQRGAEDETAESRVTTLEEQLQTLGEEIARRREVVSRSDGARGDLETRIRNLEHALVLDRERHSMTTTRHSEIRTEVEALEGEKATLAAADLEGGRRAMELTGQIETLRTSLERDREALVLAQREDAALHRRAEELRGQIASLEQRITEQGSIAQGAARPLADGPEADKVNERRRQLLLDFVAYRRRRAELSERAAAAEAKLAEAREAAAGARERLARVQNELRELERASQGPLRELDHLRGRLEVLKRVQAESEGIATGTRNALIMGQVLIENVRPGSLGEAPEVTGVVGLLSRHLRVPAGLEAAINAALEHHLHAIIVEQETQALHAIELLREGARGRAQFLPLDGLRKVYPLNLQKERGVVGVASRLVRCDSRFRDLVDTLLGRIIVVEDMRVAKRMLTRGLGAVVTLDGVLLDPSGVITGGIASDSESPFSFTRQREIDELPAQITELEKVVEANREQVETARETVDRLSRLVEESDIAHEECRTALDEALRARDRERDRLYRIRREMTHVLVRRRELAGGSFDEHAARNARALLDQFNARRTELTAELEGIAPDLEAALGRVEQAVDEVAGASARLAAAEGEARAQALAREQQKRAIERLSSQIAQRILRAQNLELEAGNFAEAIERQTQELEQLRVEQESSTDDTAPDRDELTRLETHERSVQAEYGEAQAALLEARRRRLDLEAGLDRARERLETLRTEMAREGLDPSPGGGLETPASSTDEQFDLGAVEAEIAELRGRIRKLGPINQEAPDDFRESEERFTFLTEQIQDLTDAEAQLQGAITELNSEIRTRFRTTFAEVDSAFGNYFTAFFGGGAARLKLLDPDDIIDSGIEIEAQPPGKRLSTISLLSGGERSLTAVALLFALLSVNPAPFCVLDEVDAALDEANVGRFVAELARLADRTQFLIVTHNRRTIEATDAIYGVSMGPGGVSSTLSLRLSDLPGGAPPPREAPEEAPAEAAEPTESREAAGAASR